MPAYRTFERRQSYRNTTTQATRRQAISHARKAWNGGALLVIQFAANGAWQAIPAHLEGAQRILATGVWTGVGGATETLSCIEEVAAA